MNGATHPSFCITSLLALELILCNRESSLQQLRLLLGMAGLQSSSHTCAGVTTSIHDVLTVVVLGLVQKGLQAGLRERPGTGVKRLFLAPHDSLGVGVLVEVLLQLLPGEGVELLNTGDGSSFVALIGAVLVERGVNLAGTQDDAVDRLGVVDAVAVLWVGNYPLELRVSSELFNRRAG